MKQARAITLIAALVAGNSSLDAQDILDDANRADAGSYVIGVEDVLDIRTWQEPELTMETKVRPDGRITLPLINEVEVAGLTPNEVREMITERMKDYIRDPNVTVIVKEINHFRVYFLGEVATRGPKQFYRPTRLLQALAEAGGLSDFSKGRITILREESGVERRIEVDYKKLWSGDPSQVNIFLKPGDTLLIK